MKKSRHYLTGWRKRWIYLRIALDVFAYFAGRRKALGLSLAQFVQFLRRALTLLQVFRHNKVVRVSKGYKLHLYLPAWPSPAFYNAIRSKLLRDPPGPVTVVFSMTKRCNFLCEHCYQRLDQGPDLDKDLMIDLARKVQDEGVSLFDIEGGEPFMQYIRLHQLVRAIDDRSEIWINTNGFDVAPDKLAQLREAGLYGLMISIHDPDPATHDQFSGMRGSYQCACDTLNLARSLDLATAINCVLSEESLNDQGLERIMDLGRDYACDYVQLIHPKPAGLWLDKQKPMQCDPKLLEKVRRAHIRYNSAARADYPSLAAQAFEEHASVLGCTAGAVDRFYINACGEVQPCEFLNLSFGNAGKEDFQAIYDRMRACFPHPCTDWLCCTQAVAIRDLFKQIQQIKTPLSWPETRKLIESWQRGKPTPVYKKLGIYAQKENKD